MGGGSCIDCLPVLNNVRGQMLPLPRSAACAKTQYTRITSDYNRTEPTVAINTRVSVFAFTRRCHFPTAVYTADWSLLMCELAELAV